MTNPDYTALLFIIDESGSMYGIANDMKGGIETLLDEQTKLPGKLTVDVAYFDSEFRYPVSMVAAAEAEISIVPKGRTALHDAVVRASNQFGETLAALPEDERPGTVMVVIVTDGAENASTESNEYDVKDLVTRQQNEYSWNYVFLGANQDAVLTGNSFGIRSGSSLTYVATAKGTVDAANLLSSYTATTRSGGRANF